MRRVKKVIGKKWNSLFLSPAVRIHLPVPPEVSTKSACRCRSQTHNMIFLLTKHKIQVPAKKKQKHKIQDIKLQIKNK